MSTQNIVMEQKEERLTLGQLQAIVSSTDRVATCRNEPLHHLTYRYLSNAVMELAGEYVALDAAN